MEQKLQKEDSLGLAVSSELSFIKKLAAGFEKSVIVFNGILHKISSVLLLLLMFLTTADVVGRYFFNHPITGTYELTGLALAMIIFFSLGSAQLARDHIEIDFLTNKMPERAKELLNGMASLMLFALMCLTTWQLAEYMRRTWEGNELSGDLGLPLYVFIAVTVLGSSSFTLTFLVDAIKSLQKAVKKNES
jgi:TRAP-type transport system small permease protein